jgi:predicted adenine nucleotide alpha hydrolase (AANH) superfamily ATPase
MERNYQRELDRLLDSLDGRRRPRLLLHSCCAPCSSYVLEYLTKRFDISLLYCNPNIRPVAEYEKRLEYLRRLLEAMGLSKTVPLCSPDYDEASFLNAAAGLEGEPEGGARCEACFRLRLGRTAELAAREGFDYFCTTLTVSPHKNAALINRLGEELGGRSGVRWLPSDFKKRDGYRRSVELSSVFGLYRQSYCGCAMGFTGAD